MVRPTSQAQLEATKARRAAPMEEIREGVWAIAQPFGSVAEVYTLDYVLEDAAGDLHLIDPGVDSDENFAALGEQLASIGHGIDDIASVTATHLHHDHLGMAARVRAASGAPIAMHSLEQAALEAVEAPSWLSPAGLDTWGVPAERAAELRAELGRRSSRPRVTADVLLEDGDLLDVPGRRLRVLHTPGHTAGHVCVESDDLLFTGDHVLPNQFAGIGLGGDRGTNPLRDFHDSIALVAPLDHLEACPGHGWRFSGLGARCEQILSHHDRRTTEVAEVLDRDPDATVWRIASQLTWTAGWPNLGGYMLASALGQTQTHRDFVLDGR